MGHIQKRTEKSKRTGKTTTAWQARYSAPDGRERSKRFDRKVDAENWLGTNGADIARGRWIDPAAGRIKFADWSEQWKGTLTGLRPSTRVRDLDYLDRYLLPTFGQIALSSIDHMAVASWLAGLTTTGPTPWWDPIEQPDRKRKPISPATAVKALQILRKILATAVRAGKITSTPATRLTVPESSAPKCGSWAPPKLTSWLCRSARAIKHWFSSPLMAGFGSVNSPAYAAAASTSSKVG